MTHSCLKPSAQVNIDSQTSIRSRIKTGLFRNYGINQGEVKIIEINNKCWLEGSWLFGANYGFRILSFKERFLTWVKNKRVVNGPKMKFGPKNI